MFDLLKNKFKNFTDKIFGKTQEAIVREPSETGSGKAKEKAEEEQEVIVEEPKEELQQQSIQETKNLPEVETISVPEIEAPKTIAVEVREEPKHTISKPLVEKTEEIKKLEIKEIKSPETKIIEKEENAPFLGQVESKISEPKIIEEQVIKETIGCELTETSSERPKEKHSIFNIFKPKPKVQPPVVERVVPTPKAEERQVPVQMPKPVSEIVVPKPKFEESPIPRTEPIEKPIPKTQPIETADDLSIKKTTEIKKSFVTSIKSIFTSKVKLSEKEISEFLEEFELSLLEADVSIVSAENICKDLKEKLVNASFSKENPLEDIKEHIRESLKTQLDIDCDINNYINKTKKENQPFVIMFIGPNGAGKTTTISKFAYHYKQEGKSIVLASGDTFRAGSIDQLEKHANTIGVKLVKQAYGSDPAAVAYDAVTSARSSKADYVFIDTAGRQENNINLMQELKKIKRVVSPNLTIYIGEAQAGQAIVDQVSGFEKEIGVDGVILTKLDTDPKGGVAISILNELKKPIFYIGTGQTYDDLESFSPEFIIDRVVI